MCAHMHSACMCTAVPSIMMTWPFGAGLPGPRGIRCCSPSQRRTSTLCSVHWPELVSRSASASCFSISASTHITPTRFDCGTMPQPSTPSRPMRHAPHTHKHAHTHTRTQACMHACMHAHACTCFLCACVVISFGACHAAHLSRQICALSAALPLVHPGGICTGC